VSDGGIKVARDGTVSVLSSGAKGENGLAFVHSRIGLWPNPDLAIDFLAP